MRRITFFLLTNIAILIVLSMVLRILGVEPYPEEAPLRRRVQATTSECAGKLRVSDCCLKHVDWGEAARRVSGRSSGTTSWGAGVTVDSR